jgi:uncharacterized phage protein gp47/JayE
MAKLQFDESGVIVPTAQEIRADWVSIVESIFTVSDPDIQVNTDPDQPLGQLIDAIVGEILSKNSELAFLANQYSRKQATGIFLDALNSLYFLDRKTAAPTVVQCLCTGIAGTLIPFGAMVADSEGRRFRCNALNQAIGDSGTALIDFASIEHGALEVQPSTVTRIITTVPGWDSVTNPAAGVQGRLRESDAEFRERAKASVAVNSHGTVDAIRSVVSEIDGVIDCDVLENPTTQPVTSWGVTVPAHSVAICVEGGASEDIAHAIYQKKDGGCGTFGNLSVTWDVNTYKILRPTLQNCYVKILFARALSESEQAAVRSAVLADANGEGENARVGLAERLYASRFWQAILSATPVALASVQVRLGDSGEYSDVVTINADIEPVFSNDTIVIEAEE